MHRVRLSVRENRLADPGRITEEDYRRMIEEIGCGWVFESDSEILGFGIVDLSERSIWALFVAPQHEGKGIGSALLEAMVTCAFEESRQPISLTTTPGTRAESFYRQAGWQVAGVTQDGELRFALPSR